MAIKKEDWLCENCMNPIDEPEPEICGRCRGSGEGAYDGTRCPWCGGHGVGTVATSECEECHHVTEQPIGERRREREPC